MMSLTKVFNTVIYQRLGEVETPVSCWASNNKRPETIHPIYPSLEKI